MNSKTLDARQLRRSAARRSRSRAVAEPRPIPTYPSHARMIEAGAAFKRTVDHWRGEEGPRSHLTIAGGMFRLWDRDLARQERRLERAAAARRTEADLAVALGVEADNVAMSAQGRGRVTGWSWRSRERMKDAFATADWSQLFDGTKQACLVTLTMPHDWVQLAPTARDFKRIVDRWQRIYQLAWGERIGGAWKMEFQMRWGCWDGSCSVATRPVEGDPHDPKAPHLHILTTLQEGAPATKTLSKVSGMVADDFRSWLSISWVKACRTREILGDAAAATHEAAGTGVDVEETLRYGDPKRMADYFAKHGTFEAKSYQNEMPAIWNVAEQGGANFWGLWGILRTAKAADVIEVDARVADQLARQVRRRSAAQNVQAERSVWRGSALPRTMVDALQRTISRLRSEDAGSVDFSPIINSASQVEDRALELLKAGEDPRWRRVWRGEDGVLRLHRKRKVRRRIVRMRRNRGRLLVNDGVAAAAWLARLVEHYGRDYGLLDQPEYGILPAEVAALATELEVSSVQAFQYLVQEVGAELLRESFAVAA